MKTLPLILAAVVSLFAFSATAQPAAEIAQTERDFATDTKNRSFVFGFNKYAAPNAIWFNPEARKVQEDLIEMRKTPSMIEGSKLRWWPHHIGIAKSGDFGFDLGPWYIEGLPNSGFYFTIWQKIAPGIWAYSIDTGAGHAISISRLPKPENLKPFEKSGKGVAKVEYQKFETNLNFILKDSEASSALPQYMFKDSILGIEGSEFEPNNTLNSEHFKKIPKGNWENKGFQFSSSGDMAASFGEVKGEGGKILGDYIRLWFTENTFGAKPKIYIQLYRPRK